MADTINNISTVASGNSNTAEPANTVPPTAETHHNEDLEDEELEADLDSAYEGSVRPSETTSLNSSLYRGYVEHGRRYQTVREGPTQYPVPSDDKQFESMESGHLQYIILDSGCKNPLFRSPISGKAQNILDLGTGQGNWAIDVADRFPNITVHGVDLYPPPQTWVPPNCLLEVDDITKPWTYQKKFDLIHLRLLLGSFPYEEWDKVYAQAYENLVPGGWIEHLEVDIRIQCDDGTLPQDSILANEYAKAIIDAADKSGNPVMITEQMTERIKKAGFTNVQEKVYKSPIGNWPKLKVYKDAGACSMMHFKDGLEGWCMWLLTKFGSPKPWSPEEVTVWTALVRQELDKGYHIYDNSKRVWAQKPLDA